MNKKFTKIFGVVVAVAFALTASVPAASALTADGLITDASLAKSLAGGSSSSSSSCAVYTSDQTLGSTGAEVVSLQTYLESKGFLTIPAGVSKGYFGPLTQSALAAYQASMGISPAVGYFGPITRANVTSNCTVSGGSDSDDDDSSSDDSLSGGAGSVDTYELVSSYNNEEVGEGESDVAVLGLEVEVDEGSDLRFTAVKVVFAQGTADNDDFEDYIEEVAIVLDGDVVATIDGDEFTDGNSYTKTITLDSSAIIREGDTGVFTIELTGANNVDSGDLSETWTADITQFRFKDATGATISEDPSTATRTFSVESFATAADVELKITSGDSDVNDARVIEVDSTNDTDGVELFSFNLEAKGNSDITIDDMPVLFTTVGADLDGIANTLYIMVDGEEIASESVPSSATTTSLITFDDIDWTIDAGDKVEVIIVADINDIEAGTFDEGDTISVTFGESETDNTLFDAEDEEGDDLSDADKTGGTSSDTHVFYETGIQVSLVSIEEKTTVQDSADNDTAQFIIKYNVTAFGGDVYVGDTASATTVTSIPDTTVSSNRVVYRVDEAGTATTADLTGTVVTFTKNGSKVTDSGVTNGVKIAENETGSFTLTVTRTNSGDADDDGSYRAALKAISWATSDTATQNVYDFDLDDFESDYVFIN